MSVLPVDAADFQKHTRVSRETLERLTVYHGLLRKWQPSINLVGPKTLDEAWSRHFFDSAQLWSYLPPDTRTLVDLGSGAGFPGLVLAVMGVPDVHLIESDARKCAFLREVARTTDTKVTIHNRRIEAVAPFAADVVTARALAPLSALLTWAAPFLSGGGTALFLKGQTADDELTEAGKSWTMGVERFPSLTEPSAAILRLSAITH